MNRSAMRIEDYLGHILDAIGRIERYTEDVDELGFLQSEMIQDAVLRNIEIIGEAARNIERASPEFAADHPEIPLTVIYTMRNRIAHGYFQVDMEIIWRTIKRDLPELATSIANVHKQ